MAIGFGRHVLVELHILRGPDEHFFSLKDMELLYHRGAVTITYLPLSMVRGEYMYIVNVMHEGDIPSAYLNLFGAGRGMQIQNFRGMSSMIFTDDYPQLEHRLSNRVKSYERWMEGRE